MTTAKLEPYSLYQTFSQNIPTEPISVKDKKYVVKTAKNFTTTQKIAFIRLILEHNVRETIEAKNKSIDKDKTQNESDGHIFATRNILELPYAGKDIINTEDDLSEIEYDFNTLPKPLQWILFKFTKMSEDDTLI